MGIGLLVGFEREWSYKDTGARTFAITASGYRSPKEASDPLSCSSSGKASSLDLSSTMHSHLVRGWYLLAVLERIARLAGREVQRVGLSATLGNPEEILAWMTRGTPKSSRVLSPRQHLLEAEVQLDYVGSIENAARVARTSRHPADDARESQGNSDITTNGTTVWTLRAFVNDTVEGAKIAYLIAVPEILRQDLGRHVIDMLRAIV